MERAFVMKFTGKSALTLTGLAMALALGACGVKGDLAVPAPLWGKPDPNKAASTLPDSQVQEQDENGQPVVQDEATSPKPDANAAGGG